jgi:hypothetical protein
VIALALCVVAGGCASRSTSNGWSVDDDAPRTREKAEAAAFEYLNAEFEQRWATQVAGSNARP